MPRVVGLAINSLNSLMFFLPLPPPPFVVFNLHPCVYFSLSINVFKNSLFSSFAINFTYFHCVYLLRGIGSCLSFSSSSSKDLSGIFMPRQVFNCCNGKIIKQARVSNFTVEW